MLSLRSIRDEDLLCQLLQLVKQSRGVEAELVAHIGEVELRRLYAHAACSSMFEYCRRVLGFRENEAYLRIKVARAAREYPVLLEMLRDGRLHLSGIARLAPHLTRQNLAVLQTWADTQSAGWVRMILDEEKIPYALIMDEDVRKGSLRERFDLVLYPNTGRSLKDIVNGIDPRHAPLAYTRTAQFPTHGTPSATADMTGGFTWSGVQNLENFVREGGVLVTLGGASTLPLDGGIARDVRRATLRGLTNPGSELRARFRRPDHPLAYGYPETTSVFRDGGPVYAVRRVDAARIVLQWGTKLP